MATTRTACSAFTLWGVYAAFAFDRSSLIQLRRDGSQHETLADLRRIKNEGGTVTFTFTHDGKTNHSLRLTCGDDDDGRYKCRDKCEDGLKLEFQQDGDCHISGVNKDRDKDCPDKFNRSVLVEVAKGVCVAFKSTKFTVVDGSKFECEGFSRGGFSMGLYTEGFSFFQKHGFQYANTTGEDFCKARERIERTKLASELDPNKCPTMSSFEYSFGVVPNFNRNRGGTRDLDDLHTIMKEQNRATWGQAAEFFLKQKEEGTKDVKQLACEVLQYMEFRSTWEMSKIRDGYWTEFTKERDRVSERPEACLAGYDWFKVESSKKAISLKDGHCIHRTSGNFIWGKYYGEVKDDTHIDLTRVWENHHKNSDLCKRMDLLGQDDECKI